MTKEQHVTFERNLPDEAILIEIDADKLTQVLDNIISNAMKYSPEGGKVTFRLNKKKIKLLSVSEIREWEFQREVWIKFLNAFIV